MNRKLKKVGIGTAIMEVLLHLRDGEADGSLRSNTSTEEGGDYTLGEGAVALGIDTKASGAWAHAEGHLSTASGDASHAEGDGSIASSSPAHAEGTNTKAEGNSSHSEGHSTTASGGASHAEGSSTVASGWQSHAEGKETISSGTASHSEGIYTVASMGGSHAEGKSTNAIGGTSHAEGYLTTASANSAHAEGRETTASGEQSHAEGKETTASGNLSHASGYGTIAQRAAQTAIGKFNIADIGGTDATSPGKWVFIIGRGADDSTRSNAFEVEWNGNTKIAGTLTQASDRRLKDHREYLGEKSVTLINALRPAHFYKDEESHVGLHAQEVEDIDPYRSLINEMNGFKTVNYTELIPHLITYCQHLEQRIAELERRAK